MAIAAALLALQIVGALEYTAGGSLYATASMIAAMIILALLPVFIEAARRARAYLLAFVLLVTFGAFLGYTLPATIGRTGEVKEAKNLEAKKSIDDVARIAADYEKSKGLVAEAQTWAAGECKSGNGVKCKGATFVLEQRTAYAEKLRKSLEDQQPAKIGDIGSETLSWALAWAGVPAEIIRRWSVLSFGLGLDFAIWALFWFAASDRLRWPVEEVRLKAWTERQDPISDAEIEELKKVLQISRAPLSNQQLASALGVSEAEASKRVAKAVAAGAARKARSGREVAITLH